MVCVMAQESNNPQEKIEKELAQIETKLSDSNFCIKKPEEFTQMTKRHAELGAKKEQLEEEWLEIAGRM